jgi:hypothetical protein
LIKIGKTNICTKVPENLILSLTGLSGHPIPPCGVPGSTLGVLYRGLGIDKIEGTGFPLPLTVLLMLETHLRGMK